MGSRAHVSSKLQLKDILIPTDNETILFHYDNHLNSTQGLKPTITKVRYIRDYISGSTANAYNHWVEIQAIDEYGNNVALGKLSGAPGYMPRVTDGDTRSAYYYDAGSGTDKYVEIDLGAPYDIKYIRVWHYYADGRTYHNNKTMVSCDGSHWIVVFDSSIEGEYQETANGHLIDLSSIHNQYITYRGDWFGNCLAITKAITNLASPSVKNSITTTEIEPPISSITTVYKTTDDWTGVYFNEAVQAAYNNKVIAFSAYVFNPHDYTGYVSISCTFTQDGQSKNGGYIIPLTKKYEWERVECIMDFTNITDVRLVSIENTEQLYWNNNDNTIYICGLQAEEILTSEPLTFLPSLTQASETVYTWAQYSSKTWGEII